MRNDYVDTEYKTEEKELVCEFRVNPVEGKTLEDVSKHVAGESSIDSWSEISALTPELAKRLQPHVFYINEETGTIRIAYSPELFEIGSIPQVLSAVAGNIMSMKIVDGIRLEDIKFPQAMLEAFRGPKFGMKKVKDLFGVYDRPLVGTIVKPCKRRIFPGISDR